MDLNDADMDVDVSEHSLDDLLELAEFLSEYRITVWTLEQGLAFPTVIFDENQQARGFISLYYYDNHFDFFHPTVESVKARFCFKCGGTLAKKYHFKKCAALCKRCGFLKCERDDTSIYCPACNIHFLSEKCFEQHLKKQEK